MYVPCAAACVTRGAYTSYMPRGFQSRAFSLLLSCIHIRYACVFMYMCVFIYVCVYIYLRMCVHVHVTYTSKRTESNFSWERHFMSSCCLFGRQRSVRRRWKIMESRCLWVTGTLISGRLKWLRATWTYVSRVQMNGE